MCWSILRFEAFLNPHNIFFSKENVEHKNFLSYAAFPPTLVGLQRSLIYKLHIEPILTSHRQSSLSVIFMKRCTSQTSHFTEIGNNTSYVMLR